jgi:2-haloacid dehalogenase
MSRSKNLALIFDLGGVLLDWNPRYLFQKEFDGDNASMERFLMDIDFYAWNLEQDKGRSFAEGVVELSARFPQYADLIKAYDERWEESIRGLIQPTVDTLLPLKKNGHSLYGLTNSSEEKFRLVAQKFAFFQLFEIFVVSGMVRLAKPDERIFQLILEKIGRPADECVFIDDSAVNTTAARELGFNTILFESAHQMMLELEQIEMHGCSFG